MTESQRLQRNARSQMNTKPCADPLRLVFGRLPDVEVVRTRRDAKRVRLVVECAPVAQLLGLVVFIHAQMVLG